MKRILITGAAGFLGSHLCDRFIKEGYFADLVVVNLNKPNTVTKESLLYKCGWSPFEGQTFASSIEKTFVSGHLVYDNGTFDETKKGERLTFIK